MNCRQPRLHHRFRCQHTGRSIGTIVAAPQPLIRANIYLYVAAPPAWGTKMVQVKEEWR